MDDLVLGAPPGFPGPPDPSVFSGLAGAIAEQVAPETEADPLAVLTQLLVSAGALIGRGAFFQIEATRHHSNEFVVLVGDSAKARKGLTRTAVRDLFARNVSAERIEEALGALQRDGRAACRRSPTGGRPAECWFAGSPER